MKLYLYYYRPHHPLDVNGYDISLRLKGSTRVYHSSYAVMLNYFEIFHSEIYRS